MGFCGEWQLDMLPGRATGIPNQFDYHPFRFIDHKEQAYIRKQAARRTTVKATKRGQRFFMDFGFMRSSTAEFGRPDPTKDRMVESYDGYSAYLAIVDEASRHLWVFLRKSKEPPLDIVREFLHLHGLASGGVIRCDQGEAN